MIEALVTEMEEVTIEGMNEDLIEENAGSKEGVAIGALMVLVLAVVIHGLHLLLIIDLHLNGEACGLVVDRVLRIVVPWLR